MLRLSGRLVTTAIALTEVVADLDRAIFQDWFRCLGSGVPEVALSALFRDAGFAVRALRAHAERRSAGEHGA